MQRGDKLPLTVLVIAQDEEHNLEDCLRSADFAAELLVLDGGSRDRTREIARALGARVEERTFDGYISQKNAGLRMASHDWLLSLDADERLSPELRDEILELFREGLPPHAAYTMPRRAWHLGRWIRGGGWYPDRKLRLFNKKHARWGGRDPHDKVLYDGVPGRLRGDILHYPYRDLVDHLLRMERYTTVAAETAFAQGRRWPLLRMLVQPPLRFFKAYVLRGGFRDGRAGFVLAAMAALYERMRYAKLWDLQRKERSS